MTVTPEVYDAYFQRIADPAVTWSASPTRFATIDENGLIHAVAPGFANIRFAIDTLVQGFTLFVDEPAASVEIAGAPATLAVSDSAVLEAVARDADWEILNFRRFYWTTPTWPWPPSRRTAIPPSLGVSRPASPQSRRGTR